MLWLFVRLTSLLPPPKDEYILWPRTINPGMSDRQTLAIWAASSGLSKQAPGSCAAEECKHSQPCYYFRSRNQHSLVNTLDHCNQHTFAKALAISATNYAHLPPSGSFFA
jgi:hypothetical protein